MKIAYLAVASLLALACTACTTPSPQIQTRVISVPSSAAYRYIKPHPDDKLTKGTLSQISRHNLAHAAVKRKEAEAKKSESR